MNKLRLERLKNATISGVYLDGYELFLFDVTDDMKFPERISYTPAAFPVGLINYAITPFGLYQYKICPGGDITLSRQVVVGKDSLDEEKTRYA